MQNNKNHPAPMRLNYQIKSREVRLIGANGENLGVFPTKQAQQKADAAKTDLIEISPNAVPPVCQLINRGKFLYQKEKLHKEQRKHQQQHDLKEIQMGVNIAPNDFQTKMRHATDFLKNQANVRIRIRLKGREKAHPEIAVALARKTIQALATDGQTADNPKVENHNVILRFHYKIAKAPVRDANPEPLRTAPAPAQQDYALA